MTITIIPRLPRVFLSNPKHHRLLSTRPQVTIGIRREDPGRIWERRCPLTPEAVEVLVKKEGVSVLVQDCDRRVFGVGEFVKVCVCHLSLILSYTPSYIHPPSPSHLPLSFSTLRSTLTPPYQAGAQIHPTLSPAHIIIGIKETPLSELLTSPVPSPTSPEVPIPRTHFMFSHTTKGQPYNMELLSRFLRDNPNKEPTEPRLIDYELLVGKDGKRSVGFGWFAGGSFRFVPTASLSRPLFFLSPQVKLIPLFNSVAGALESLSAMAHAHLELGVASPFLVRSVSLVPPKSIITLIFKSFYSSFQTNPNPTAYL
jgi:alpha-aminoadipic semialdehyde synthase